MSPIALFLDFDGVFCAPVRPGAPEVGLARHADALLSLAVARFAPCWLTTRKGSVYKAFDEICQEAELRLLARRIPIADFDTLKVEAFPTNSDFLWLDDAPLSAEVRWLEERGLLDRLVRLRVRREPHDLLRVAKVVEAVLARDTTRG